MITIKLHDEDVPFVMAALRNRTTHLMDSVRAQVSEQLAPPVSTVKPVVKLEAAPVEATLTPKRGPGRPKGVKNRPKKRVAKKTGASK